MTVKTLEQLEDKYKTYFTKSNLWAAIGWLCPLAMFAVMIYFEGTESKYVFIAMVVASWYCLRFKSEVPENQKIALDDVLSIGKEQGYSEEHITKIKESYANGETFNYGQFLLAHSQILLSLAGGE